MIHKIEVGMLIDKEFENLLLEFKIKGWDFTYEKGKRVWGVYPYFINAEYKTIKYLLETLKPLEEL